MAYVAGNKNPLVQSFFLDSKERGPAPTKAQSVRYDSKNVCLIGTYIYIHIRYYLRAPQENRLDSPLLWPILG